MKRAWYKCLNRKVIAVFVLIVISSWMVLGARSEVPTVEQKENYQIEEKTSDLQQNGFGIALFRTVVSLILVVGLVYLGMYGLKRFIYRSKGSGGIPIRVVGSTLLGPKKGIYLVEVEDRRLVLGVTDANVSFLTELKKRSPTEFKQIPVSDENRISGRGFKDYLVALMKRRGIDE